ncbi:hypothetical protein [Parasulfitobacter algicola]|uniref:Uncharacterized protein n=1 Tax=Parasulfitobacter algicola TaxID=2614809 RepID=A0ABX2INS4_9RHOB|nr:hypothetical protein [Sulfitobacter algicola]NSX54513.1 hypothetical protein [Sulfitobacter algicola]
MLTESYYMLNIPIATLIIIMVLWSAMSVPVFIVIRRLGLSPWWNVMHIVPFYGGLILLWIVALKRWPEHSVDPVEVFE